MAGDSASSVRSRCRARDNPFRVERILTVRYRPRQWTWDQLLARLHELQFRAAICGPQGSGKTTLLEDLIVRLSEAGLRTRLLEVRRETRRVAGLQLRQFLAEADRSDILVVDGSEQLRHWTWRRLLRHSRRHPGLIVTSHAAGRLPTLVQCETDVELLESIVAQLVPHAVARLRGHLPALYAAHKGNLRMCLRQLFDLYAGNSESFAGACEDLS